MATEASSSQPMAVGETPRSITLHILCQSLPPPSRLTLEDVPLSITLAQLKERIEQAFPGNPRASTQKLIYRGKVLNIDGAILRTVVSSVEEDIDSMHLVLPPPELTRVPPLFQMSQNVPGGSSRTSGSTLFNTSNSRSSVTGASPSVASGATTSAGAALNSPPPHIVSNQFVHVPSPHSQRITQQSANLHGPFLNARETNDSGVAQQILAIRTQIENIERGLDYGLIPPMEHVIHLRTQLLDFQDRQHSSQLPLVGITGLISRLLEIQQRTRTQGPTQQQHPHSRTNFPVQNRWSWVANTTNTCPPGTSEEGVQIFMVTSPSGNNSVIVNGPELPMIPSQSMFLPNAAARTHGAGAPPPPYPNGGVAQNAVRQALANQQRRGDNIEHAGLARHIRRIWLFARLWFFCYLISAPGTWRRYIFVSISLLVTFLSETDIPQQLLRLVVNPVQRHLEGLTHAGGPADPSTQGGADGAATGFDVWDLARRLERSLVLLFASLIPGLGERQVQARTAADEAHRAEQERLARVRREEEEAPPRQGQEQVQEQVQE
ncbi:hypothetical protein N7457_009846 [Penicillium paradoxum]|uniref:uncharacterized protein n=1 Tax=Penicillium paradoxum TaxID=176176 RepID=UPI00254890AC|nr:uncharacterized protein N7457_009846 [Penicillium paradoxum]KAJ5774950.1 hypothetical protein N7457_009846 [Penicillium paradoxum]